MTTPSDTAPAGQVHTATPWRVYENETGIGVTTASAEYEDTDGDGCDICAMDNEGIFGIATVRANAAHIVHCVNSHSHLLAQNAALVEALRLLHPSKGVWRLPGDSQEAQIEAALKLVTP